MQLGNFQAFPNEVATGAPASGQRYHRAPGLFAMQCQIGSDVGMPVLWTLEAEGIAVVEGDPAGLARADDPASIRAVYRLAPDGPILVPTGKAFARFRESVAAADREAAIARCGYQIESIPSYAPFCAWLRPADGSVASGLNSISELLALPDIESVEPEMLGPRALR